MLPGQWFGKIQGTNQGFVVLSVDRDRPNVGWIQVYDNQQPCSLTVDFTVNGKNVTGVFRDWVIHGAARPGITMPTAGNLHGTLNHNAFTGQWRTDVNTNGTFQLNRAEAIREYNADRTMQWREFRDWVLDDTDRSSSKIFRGHSRSTYVLWTSFHRTGRRNLSRYAHEDVPILCRHVEATVNARYDLQDPNDFGGLLYLAQHHGFPTPLLDWSNSPFVAAYFAFAETEYADDGDKVRVLQFDLDGWPYCRGVTIDEITPTFSPLMLRAVHNPRALPQQSAPMFSNVVDIDKFISSEEQRLSRQFLRRIDIPASERSVAMRDLAMMGVTAGSLFPGLDGVCRTLRDRRF